MSFATVTLDLLESFLQNGLVFVLTLLGAIPLGLVITLGSMAKFKPLRYLVKTYVGIIRGTPLMLQLFVVMYVPGLVFDMPMQSRLTAVMIAFIINYSAYFSEIYRGGIEAIPKGQYEAGQVLGMTRSQIFFKIVLFQVIKRIVPPMGNEIIKAAERYTAMGYIWPLFYTGVFFLIFVGALTLLFGWIERKLDYYKG